MGDVYGGTVHGAPKKARHAKVLDLFREWARDHENRRCFVRQEEIIAYQATLNAFLDKARQVVAAVKAQTLADARFKDSLDAAGQLIALAEDKRAFFDRRFALKAHASNTFGRAMTFDEQRMVPQTRDLGPIQAKIDELSALDGGMTQLTPSQAWALVAANAKGALNEAANFERAVARLQQLNDAWHTNYGLEDLQATFRYMISKTRIATQYRLEQAPGQQQGQAAVGAPLYKLLMQGGFRNVWETGTSQASADLSKRGAVEEQMGYGSALRRVAGTAQDYNDATGRFDPRDAQGRSRAGEMPRYAATIGDAQTSGVAQRYGTSYIVWKESVRRRVTWTPGDSWSLGGVGPQSVKSHVGLDHPEAVFVHAEEGLLRVFMAEATGKDGAWLKATKARGGDFGGAYVETQIHGDLTWNDVEMVVLDAKLPTLATVRKDFEEFARTKVLGFTVRTTAELTAASGP